MAFIRSQDASTVYPLWIGAHKQALDRKLNGITDSMEDKEKQRLAAEYADVIIQTSQPSSRPLDQPKLQRLEGGWRVMVMFMTYRIKQGNSLLWFGKEFKAGNIGYKELSRHFFTEWWLPAALQLAIPFLAYHDDAKPEWWDFVLNPATDTISWLPGIGEVVSIAKYGPIAADIPAIEGLERTGMALYHVKKGDMWKASIEAARTVEWFMGLPVENVPKDVMKYLKKVEGEK